MGTIAAMHHPGVLQQHTLPLPQDYVFSPSEQDYLDHSAVHSQNEAEYHQVENSDALQCRIVGTGSNDDGAYALSGRNGSQYVSDRPMAQDLHYETCSTSQQDAHPASIDASPISVASSTLAYPNYSSNHYTSIASLPQVQNSAVPQLHTFPHHATLNYRHSPSLDGSLPPSQFSRHASNISHPSSVNISSGYKRHFSRNTQPFFTSHTLPVGYQSTPRITLAPSHHFPSFLASANDTHMASSPAAAYTTPPNESHGFPWLSPEVLCDQNLTCQNSVVTPEVCARMEKGFFLSPTDQSWTCYRRNYFSVSCSFELHPHIPNGKLFLRGHLVQALGMRLSAAIDGPNGKVIELVQYTPKRDSGDKRSIEIQKVSPTPPRDRGLEPAVSPHAMFQMPTPSYHSTGNHSRPLLPLQHLVDPPAQCDSATSSPQLTSAEYPYGPMSPSQAPTPGQSIHHVFDRVQFKTATANNGKRRASQQYYHLVVELYADTRASASSAPRWEKIAVRVSDKVVVRGRSPSHYKNGGTDGGPIGRGGNNSGATPSAYGNPLSRSGYRSSGSLPGTSNYGAFRASNNYEVDVKPSPTDSHASHGSVVANGNTLDVKYDVDSKSSYVEEAPMQDVEGYRYYPATIYRETAGPVKAESPISPFAQSQQHLRSSGGYAINSEYTNALPGSDWPAEGFSRFRGVEASVGYYPALGHSEAYVA